jgi:hypothetical protein
MYSEAIDVFASAGRGGKRSVSVCVCRANKVSGRLIKWETNYCNGSWYLQAEVGVLTI